MYQYEKSSENESSLKVIVHNVHNVHKTKFLPILRYFFVNDKINEKIIVHKQMFSKICLSLHKVKSCERLELCERLKCLKEKIVHENFSYISILLVVCERCERCERLLLQRQLSFTKINI